MTDRTEFRASYLILFSTAIDSELTYYCTAPVGSETLPPKTAFFMWEGGLISSYLDRGLVTTFK